MSFVTELKRRKVFRVAVVYAATAFVVLQAADIMLPRLGIPDWVNALIVLLVILGFPIALVLAWALELTPDGLKRTDSIPAAQAGQGPAPALLGKRTMFVAALLVVLGVGIGTGWFLRPASGPDASPAGQTRQVAGPDVSAETSIAVLPFLNMSTDPENAFFADGISEELLNVLVRVEGLKVASRTSAFSFKGSNTPIPEIARQLGVRHILEGSVRRQDNRVRITAQLIETYSDTHLWSQTYERELEDIFRVQEEIAIAITTALEDILGTRQVSVDAPTDNLQAYQHFLHGRSLFYQRVSLDEAIAQLRQAVALDPEFAEAWAFLAASEFVVSYGGYETEMNQEALMRRAAESVERALTLDASIPIAQAVKGQLLIDSKDVGTMVEALALSEAAASRVSADSTPKMWLGMNLLRLGDIERAFDLFEQAHAQDPLVAINNGYLGITHAMLGWREEGAQYALRAVELSGALTYWISLVAIDASHAGDIDQAAAFMADAGAALAPETLDSAFVNSLKDALIERVDYRDWIERYPPPPGPMEGRFRIQAALLLRSNEAALQAHNDDRTRLNFGQLIHAAWMPGLVELREDPELFALMADFGLVDYWQAHGFPLGCRPVDDPAGRRLDCSGDAP